MRFKFKPGSIYVTRGASDLAGGHHEILLHYLKRHLCGDWGSVCADDAAENEISLREGYRIISEYDLPEGRIWIVTEADRSYTTILLPEEY